MKKSVSNFDLEAAFKALDEIELPIAEKGITANKVNLTETFKLNRNGKSKTDLLIEDYYDVNDTADLEQAQADREEEVAKAKLARIEKIVDLDAQTAEELLPSYVGKRIIQCPQCMTLFYKSEEDIEPSENDENVVNEGEICQHCGNDSGYTLIGKVDAVSEEEKANYDEAKEAAEDEEAALDLDLDLSDEELEDSETNDKAEKELDIDLSLPEADEEETDKEDKDKKESLNLSKNTSDETSDNTSEQKTLNEETNKENIEEATAETLTEAVAEAEAEKEEADFNYDFFIEDAYYYLNKLGYFDVIGKQQAEDILAAYDKYMSKRKNGKAVGKKLETKALDDGSIRIQVTEGLLDNALSNNNILNNNDVNIDLGELGGAIGGALLADAAGEKDDVDKEPLIEAEDPKESDIDKMLDSKEFTTPVTDAEVQSYFDEADQKETAIDEAEDFVEESFNACITNYLQEVYQNVQNFALTNCTLNSDKLICEGVINFNSGKTKNTTFTFTKTKRNNIFEGLNKDFSDKKAFMLEMKVDTDKKAITEKLSYHYSIDGILVEGIITK